VKEDTLLKLANGLGVPLHFFNVAPPATELTEKNGESASPLMMLRELDIDGLLGLLKTSEKIDWHLDHLKLVDEQTCGLLEKLGKEVHRLHHQLNPNFWDMGEEDTDPFTFEAQWHHMKQRHAVANLIERLAEQRISILGADFLHWHSVKDDLFKHVHSYTSRRILALSLEQSGIRSRPLPIFSGPQPPKVIPETDPPTRVLVNGVPLPGSPPDPDADDEIPF
jgi:hypothetical protein